MFIVHHPERCRAAQLSSLNQSLQHSVLRGIAVVPRGPYSLLVPSLQNGICELDDIILSLAVARAPRGVTPQRCLHSRGKQLHHSATSMLLA
jgi:hypothetical protein